MDEKLRRQLRIKKVQGMKSPTILMNETDFKNLINEVEDKVYNFKVGDNPTYEGVPIKTSEFIKKGSLIIYDDALINLDKESIEKIKEKYNEL